MREGRPKGGLKTILREPVLHFLLIGTLLFAGYAWFESGQDGNMSSDEIRLTLDDLAQLEMVFQSKWQRSPTLEEFDLLVEDRIREEILYREALSMGLDKNDTIVRRRMAQKMKFLAEDLATAREPTSEELRVWYQTHSELFALPPRVSFRHLYFSIDRRGGLAYSDARQALARITGEHLDSPSAELLADPFMFQDYYGDRTSSELAKEFGPEFAQAVVKLASGSWWGPIKSGFGWHLVFIDSLTPGRIPDFEEIEPEVKTAWLGEQKAKASQEAYKEMRAKYNVLLPAPPEEAVISALGAGASPQSLVQNGKSP